MEVVNTYLPTYRAGVLRRSDAAMSPGYPLMNLDLTNNTLIGRTGLDFPAFEIIQDLVGSTDIDLDFPEIS